MRLKNCLLFVLIQLKFNSRLISHKQDKFFFKMKKNSNEKLKNEKPAKKLKTSASLSTTTEITSSSISSNPVVIKPNDLQEIRLNYDTHRLRADFFDAKCLELSKKLLNKYLVRRIALASSPNTYALIAAKIVETEAYLGGTDKASHTYNNKLTDRLKAMYMTSGLIYIRISYELKLILIDSLLS